MSVTRSSRSTTGRTNTWPMLASVMRGAKNSDWRKLDSHKGYLGLYS